MEKVNTFESDSLMCLGRILSRAVSICLLFLSSWSLVWGQGDPTPSKKLPKVNLNSFRENNRILVGKLPVMVTPFREYTLKAGASGEIEMYVPVKTEQYEAGHRLAGIDAGRLKLDQELMDISEVLLDEKEIPQWHLQRKSQIEQLESQLTKIKSERMMAEQMVRDPSKYAGLFKGSFDADKMKGENLLLYILKREKDEIRLTEILSFMNSDRKETLELGELRKKFELRKLQFEMKMKEAYLTMPFAGQVDFLFPYVEGERNFIQRGMEVALVRDMQKIHGQAAMNDSRLRLLDKNRVELQVETASGFAVGKYSKSLKKEGATGEQMIYSFEFLPRHRGALQNLLGGQVDGSIYYLMKGPVRIVPKFLLVSLSPEVFRGEGWSGLVQRFFPGHDLIQVGLNSVAVGKSVQ
jgi:hypothetical protein